MIKRFSSSLLWLAKTSLVNSIRRSELDSSSFFTPKMGLFIYFMLFMFIAAFQLGNTSLPILLI